MCGIFGTVNNTDETRCIKALRSFSYRGPDHTGYASIDGVFLGNNRLSVIDVSERSNQPLSFESYSIVFNGEIYNYKELREELILSGDVLNTDSDTEVVLRGYVKFGGAFFARLIGMFAVAILDGDKKQLVLARDISGIKPLVYYSENHQFHFASEMKGVTQMVDANLNIDSEALELFMAYGIIPAPLTLFREIKKVPAGTVMIYNLVTKSIHSVTPFQAALDNSVKKSLQERLELSIEQHIVSDVPIGVFFSGGIDSSLIAAILKKRDVNLKTYSLQIGNKNSDTEYAQKISTYLDLNTTFVPFGVNEFDVAYAEIRSVFDEPTLDSSLIALYALSKVAAKEVKVVLSGEGADELFYGYDRQLRIAHMRPLIKLPSVIQFLYSNVPMFKGRPRVFEFLYRNFTTPFAYYLFAMSPRTVDYGWKVWSRFIKKNNIHLNKFDEKIYLENDLLRKIDFATSYASIEGRVPFLGTQLVGNVQEYVDDAVKKNISKAPLKKLLSKFIPESLVYRPKSGMGLPMAMLFSQSSFLSKDLDSALVYLRNISECTTYLPTDVKYSKMHEPYFCYMLITLYWTLKNLKYHE